MYYLCSIKKLTNNKNMEAILDIMEDVEINAKDVVPSAFRTIEEGAEKGASEHYQFMTTSEIIDIVEGFGWRLFNATQTKSKKYPTTCKHMLRFRNSSIKPVGGLIPEIVLVNSHNRTSSLTFHVGIFRMVCSNGLIVSEESYGKISVRHMGATFDDVKRGVRDIITALPKVMEEVERFKSIKLDRDSIIDFAAKAVGVRYPEYKNEDGFLKYDQIKADMDLEDLVKPIRSGDESNDLFTVMNVLQEKLMYGKYTRRGKTGKTRKGKQVTNIRTNLLVNSGLWGLMNSYN